MISKSILMIVFMLIVGCDKAEGGGSTTPSNIKYRTITKEEQLNTTTTAGNYEDYIVVKPIELNLDDMTFSDAFSVQHRAHGEGHTFWWNGNEYTTDLYVDTKWHNIGGWVRNDDDTDDNCYENIWDECGICSGPGKLLWYKDSDEDGLGNPNIYIESCTYPSVDEE